MSNKSLTGILLSAVYKDKKCVLKFYEPISNRIILVRDKTGHLPHCYLELDDAEKVREQLGIKKITPIEIKDIMKDCTRKIARVETSDPLIIGGKDDSLREMYNCHEADIKHYLNYLYDFGYIVGKWYDINTLKPIDSADEFKIDVNLDGIIDKERFKEYVDHWAKLLAEPIPHFRRLAFDIEVETAGGLPDPILADQRVTAIGLHGTDTKEVFVLKRPEVELGKSDEEKQDEMIKAGGIPYEGFSKPNYKVRFFDSEKEMLEEAFKVIENYPIVLTYNGDLFDVPYLFNRAVKLGISYIPFHMIGNTNATLNMGIHIDMYGIFSNRSLKIYAFKSKYVEDKLDTVSEALLGENKTKYEGDLNDLPLYTLAKYCYNDSRLTYQLSAYNDNMVMKLLVILSRIGNMPIDDVSRLAISNWIKSLLYFTHRSNGELIPNSSDLPQIEASTKAQIEGKKYEGAIVLEPQAGIHFGVKVLDFASLYPSIIKTKNISYETVCCSHLECRKNTIPQTKHWICTKKSGIFSLLIGSLKELRVSHFKRLSKMETDKSKVQLYDTISEAIKVFMNASYGVIGFSSFPLFFLPTAEAVTSYGREIISSTVKTARDSGMNIIAGDTDSLFVKTPTVEQIKEIINITNQKYHIDLEQDKEYRYVVFSNRKKNYFGIKADGSADIKGLTGKKSNTPPFIRELFKSVVDRLKLIQRSEDFTNTRLKIISDIKNIVNGFDSLPLDKLSFKVLLNREPSDYKVKPPALKAAEQLADKPKKGTFIEYVKIWKEPGVRPISMIERKDIDKPKYLESLQTTLEQICEPMNIDINGIITGFKTVKLSEFW